MNDLDKKYIDQFLPSRDMREYLKGAALSVLDIAQVIYGAPCSVYEKYSAVKELYEIHHDGLDEYAISRIEGMIDCMEKALKIKDEEGIYALETCFYLEKDRKCGSEFESLYATFDDAMMVIKDLSENYADSYGELVWFEITKWGQSETGKLSQECTYFIVENELKYINIFHLGFDYVEDMIGGGDLNLPIPFEAGDIVEINGQPFVPRFRAVILDIGDNSDCCAVQGLARNNDGLWNTGAVKHGMIGVQSFPQPSMLYTIKKYRGPLDENDRILAEISYYMKQGADRAYELFKKISCSGDLSDGELRKLLCPQKDTIVHSSQKSVTPEFLLEVVTMQFGVTSDDIVSAKRGEEIETPRRLFMFLCKEYLNLTYSAIGKYLSERDHTKVIVGIKRVEAKMYEDDVFSEKVENIRKIINASVK